jgi:dephospho-CoA kinase
VHKRGSPKDFVSFEEFVEQEDRELKSNDPSKHSLFDAMKNADFHLENNSTIEELEEKVGNILKKCGIEKEAEK